jgi:hypothetical protein
MDTLQSAMLFVWKQDLRPDVRKHPQAAGHRDSWGAAGGADS